MALRTSLPVQPHLYIGDSLGKPLDYGMIYFGEPDRDPEFYPIDLYLDEALTIPLSQPVRTKGGFLNVNGDMIEVYAAETRYSVKVVDTHGYKVFYKPDMGSTNTDNSVSTKLSAPNAVVRTQNSKNSETVSVKDFGAKGNGTTDDAGAIRNALLYAKSKGLTLLFPSGEYLVSGSLNDLHSTATDGDGVIKSGSNVWHIRPKALQENMLYVSPTGSSANDGISSGTPTNIATANLVIQRYIGNKSGDGVWGLRMLAGTYNDNGVRLSNWPLFKSPFQWHGVGTSSQTIEPSVIWQGNVSNTNKYALLAQNVSNSLYIDFKGIHFKDWLGGDVSNPDSNAGAIVMWNKGEYRVDGCWFTRTSMGFSHRYSYARVINSRFEDCSTWGVSAAYQSTLNCGSLSSVANLFLNCVKGADVGRTSVMYVQNNTFDGCDVDIGCATMSRVRPQGNTHKNWTNFAYYLTAGAVLTPDNGQGHPETYENGNNKPIFYGDSGSFHSVAHRGSVKAVNCLAGGSNHILEAGTALTLLTTKFNDAGYVPFRLPSWTMLSDTFMLELNINVRFASGFAGQVILSGEGATGGSAEVISLTVPSVSSDIDTQVKIEVYYAGVSGRYTAIARIPELGIVSKVNRAVSSFLGEYEDSTKIFRLYASNTGTSGATFYGLRSYVEI